MLNGWALNIRTESLHFELLWDKLELSRNKGFTSKPNYPNPDFGKVSTAQHQKRVLNVLEHVSSVVRYLLYRSLGWGSWVYQ